MKPWLIIGISILVILGAAAFLRDWRFFSLTGYFFPKRIVDSLNAPIPVVAVKEAGLSTSDGRILLPPLLSHFPLYPELTKDILTNGVELTTDGTIYALVRVDHWCGNDPVRFHLARVDLSSMVLLLQHERQSAANKFGIDPAFLMLARLPHDEVKRFYESQTNGASTSRGATNLIQAFE